MLPTADAGIKVPQQLRVVSPVPIRPRGPHAPRRLHRRSFVIMVLGMTSFMRRLNVSFDEF